MKNQFKKLIAAVFLGLVVITPTYTYALWGFGDIALDPVQDESGIATQISQVTQVINQVQMILKAFGLDVVIYKVSQKLSQKLLNKVLNKANGGADGEDAKLFVTNFGQYFQDIAQQQVGQFTTGLQSSSSPFAKSLFMGISNQGGDYDSTKSLLESFSLSEGLPDGLNWNDVAGNISLAGDGAKGWDFYGKLASPQNTPIGAGIIAQDELSAKIRNAQEIAKTELASSGFKPDKDKSKLLDSLGNGSFSFSSFTGSGSSSSGGGGQDQITADLQAQHAAAEAQYAAQNNEPSLDANVNTDGDIKTPTKTNEDQSGQSVNESFDRLRNADSFGKIIFNTITQMVTGLIQKGFSSLAADGGAAQKPYGGPKDLSKVINSTASGAWANAPEQTVDLRNELDTAITKTRQEIDILETTIASVKAPVKDGTILSLEVCNPGPDTHWERRMQSYLEEQVKDTAQRAGQDGKKGTNNANALVLVRRQVQQAGLEEKALLADPFLNMPAAVEINSALREFYKLSDKFKPMFDQVLVKRQVLTNLQTMRALAQSYGATQEVLAANGGKKLVLFDSQWKDPALNKTQLYNSIKDDLIANFPEYLDKTNPTQLAPLDDPETTVDETDDEMKKRVFDQQWDRWETLVPEGGQNGKQQLYAKFISLSRDVSDSASVQRAQIAMEGAENQNKDIHAILKDCLAIREYIKQPNASAENNAWVESHLTSERIINAFPGPSILTAAANGVDFSNNPPNGKGQRILSESAELPGFSGDWDPSADYAPQLRSADLANRLQVPNLASNGAALIEQDERGELFCRLTLYTLFFWTPSRDKEDITGDPIGCSRQKPTPLMPPNDWTAPGPADGAATFFSGGIYHATNSYQIKAMLPAGTKAAGGKKVLPDWYHTNNAEILFNISD